jgi:hypothetical protein
MDIHSALKLSGTPPNFLINWAEIARGRITRAAECDGADVTFLG